MKSFTGLKDVDREILMRIESDKELMETCLLNKYSLSLCNDNFYHNRMINKFPHLLHFYPINTDWKLAYLQNMYYIGKMSEEYGFTFDSKSTGIPKIYYEILKRSNTPDEGLKLSGENGFLDLADYFISKGATDYTTALMRSIVSHKDIPVLEYFVNKIEPNFVQQISLLAFQTAVSIDNKVAMDYFVSKINLTDVMINSAISKNYKMLNYLISKGGDIQQTIRDAENTGYTAAAIFLEKYDALRTKLASLKK